MTNTEDIDGVDFYGEDSGSRLLTLMDGGPHWITVGDPSITDTPGHAEELARARLADVRSDGGP